MSQTKAQLLGPLVADDITVTGTINFDSGTFKVDSTADKVGIATGSNAPTKTLEVGGDTQIADLYYTADYPTVRPTIDLAFDKVKKLDNRITFKRESIGTIVNSDGYIETVGHNKPRFDHDPVTRESLGLLIEESRTNYFDYSESTSWESYNGGQTSLEDSTLGILSPTGSTPLVIRPTNTSLTSLLNDRYDTYPSSGGTMIFSVFVKTPTGSQYEEVQLYAQSVYGGSFAASLIFNISTLTTRGAVGTAANAGIFDYGNGWYRVCMSFTCPASTSGPIQRVAIVDDAVAQGTTQSDGLLIFGYQLELGSFPTSYIPTSGSTVTRQADGAAFEGTNLTNWYNQSEGTWIIDINKTKSIDGYYAALFYMRPTTGSDATRNEFYKKNGSGLFSYIYGNNDGTTTGSIDTTNAITSGDNTLFAYYKQEDFGVGSNGTIDNTDTSGSVQVTTDPNIYLALGSTFDPSGGSSSEHWNGHFRRFTYYPYRLNNSQIANLTL
jgi:hypothetical protein